MLAERFEIEMTTTTHSQSTFTRGVRFARRSTRGVIMGFSVPRLVAMGLAFTVVLAGLFFGGGLFTVKLTPLWLTVVSLAFVPVHGTYVADWVLTFVRFLARRVRGQLRWRARVREFKSAGALSLPGDAASLRLVVTDDEIAMLHDPHANTLTVVCAVKYTSFILLDDDEADARAYRWAMSIASFCQPGVHIKRIQILERTVPDDGVESRGYWHKFGVHDGSWACRSYEQLVTHARPDGMTHETLVAVTLDLSSASRSARRLGRGMKGAVNLLRRTMDALTRHLASIPMEVDRWLSPADVAMLIRGAYDPAAGPRIASGRVGRDPATAGPVAINESWDRIRADSGHHVTLHMTEWPRTEVRAGFLWPIILAGGIQRTFSLILEPVPPHKALKKLHGERVAYETDQKYRDKSGMVADLALQQEAYDLHQREQELVAGHGTVNFIGLVSVSALTKESLDGAVATIQSAAQQAGCELKILYGNQGAAFAAAALPLGRGIR